MQAQQFSADLLMVLTTESDIKSANYLARELLSLRVAACVSIREINSNFWWEGRIESNNESQLLIKTTKEKLKDVMKAIQKLHSYKTPEIIFWDVSSNPSYASWVEDVVSSDS